MTPEEFRDRATAAVAVLEPDPAAYDWLRANAARRRRRTRLLLPAVGTACLLTLGVAAATVPDRLGADGAAGGDRPAAGPARPFDVDGDGEPDLVTTVRSPEGGHGLRVERTRRGPTTVWVPPGLDATVLEPVSSADLDADGYAELAVRLRLNAPSLAVAFLTQHGDGLTWVTDNSGGVATFPVGHGFGSYGCAEEAPEPGREVVVERLDGGLGDAFEFTRVLYALQGDRFVTLDVKSGAEHRYRTVPPPPC